MNLNEARRHYASKFRPNPWIYWCDFLLSAGISWTALYLSHTTNIFTAQYWLLTLVGAFALLRAVLFIHEIAHLKRGSLPLFEFGYNLILGVPFLAPSLLYNGTHGDHHRQNLFGTSGDPEYAEIARWNRLRLLIFVFGVILAPTFLVIRFAILGPLSYSIPSLRRILISRASSLVINNNYRRTMAKGREQKIFIIQEITMALWIWTIALGCLYGFISIKWALQWHVFASLTLLINQVRTLAAHGYTNNGDKLSVEEQLLDSINLDGGSILTALAAPVGLRFHALHHFLPNVPYHALPSLHRELVNLLDPTSPYMQSSRTGILSAILKMLANEHEREEAQRRRLA